MMNRMLKPPPAPGAGNIQPGPGERGPMPRSWPHWQPGDNVLPGTRMSRFGDNMTGRAQRGIASAERGLDTVFDNINRELYGGSIPMLDSPLMGEAMRGDYGDEAQRLAQEIEQRAAFGLEVPPELIEQLNVILTDVQGAYRSPTQTTPPNTYRPGSRMGPGRR